MLFYYRPVVEGQDIEYVLKSMIHSTDNPTTSNSVVPAAVIVPAVLVVVLLLAAAAVNK